MTEVESDRQCDKSISLDLLFLPRSYLKLYLFYYP